MPTGRTERFRHSVAITEIAKPSGRLLGLGGAPRAANNSFWIISEFSDILRLCVCVAKFEIQHNVA